MRFAQWWSSHCRSACCEFYRRILCWIHIQWFEYIYTLSEKIQNSTYGHSQTIVGECSKCSSQETVNHEYTYVQPFFMCIYTHICTKCFHEFIQELCTVQDVFDSKTMDCILLLHAKTKAGCLGSLRSPCSFPFDQCFDTTLGPEDTSTHTGRVKHLISTSLKKAVAVFRLILSLYIFCFLKLFPLQREKRYWIAFKCVNLNDIHFGWKAFLWRVHDAFQKKDTRSLYFFYGDTILLSYPYSLIVLYIWYCFYDLCVLKCSKCYCNQCRMQGRWLRQPFCWYKFIIRSAGVCRWLYYMCDTQSQDMVMPTSASFNPKGTTGSARNLGMRRWSWKCISRDEWQSEASAVISWELHDWNYGSSCMLGCSCFHTVRLAEHRRNTLGVHIRSKRWWWSRENYCFRVLAGSTL